MSVLLSLFPSGFRYFLQPFLVLYYTPLILLRSVTSPINRKRAMAKHETVIEAWKDAVNVAEQTERDGYWPVAVNDDGYFELTKPPSVDGVVLAATSTTDTTTDNDSDTVQSMSETNAKMAEAMAAAVEHAMEVNDDNKK